MSMLPLWRSFMEEAYEGDGLTLTNADNTTEPLSGIDQFPIPPQR